MIGSLRKLNNEKRDISRPIINIDLSLVGKNATKNRIVTLCGIMIDIIHDVYYVM